MILVVDLFRAGTLLIPRATLRQVRVSADGAVAGQIRAPIGAEQTLWSTDSALTFQLPDGRTVECTVHQAGDAFQWGKFNGRVVE